MHITTHLHRVLTNFLISVRDGVGWGGVGWGVGGGGGGGGGWVVGVWWVGGVLSHFRHCLSQL